MCIHKNFMVDFEDDSHHLAAQTLLAIAKQAEKMPLEEQKHFKTTNLSIPKSPVKYVDYNILAATKETSSDCRLATTPPLSAMLISDTWSYQLKQKITRVGRIARNDLFLESSADCIDTLVDLHLGTSKLISRKHIEISYNEEKQSWFVTACGKNGVSIDGHLYRPSCPPVRLPRSYLMDGHCRDFGVTSMEEGTGLAFSATDSSVKSENYIVEDFSSESTSGYTIKSEKADYGTSKPSISYSNLIAEAINSTPDKRRTLSGIYSYIVDHYPYYQNAKSGWQNSIRHNLSLNKAFIKIPRNNGEPGKGMFWVIDPRYCHLFEKNCSSKNYIKISSSIPNFTMQKCSAPETSSNQQSRSSRLSIGASHMVANGQAQISSGAAMYKHATLISLQANYQRNNINNTHALNFGSLMSNSNSHMLHHQQRNHYFPHNSKNFLPPVNITQKFDQLNHLPLDPFNPVDNTVTPTVSTSPAMSAFSSNYSPSTIVPGLLFNRGPLETVNSLRAVSLSNLLN